MENASGWEMAMQLLPTLTMFLVILFYFACLGRIFNKAGRPVGAAFVPVYNIMKVLEIVGRPSWWIIVWLFLSPIIAPFLAVDLAKSFGKSSLYGVVMLFFLFFIGLPMLAFGNARYIGPSVYTPPKNYAYRRP